MGMSQKVELNVKEMENRRGITRKLEGHSRRSEFQEFQKEERKSEQRKSSKKQFRNSEEH